MKTTVRRIEWIDVLKGILIILMIMGHVPNLARRMGCDDTNYHYFYLILQVYGCFFMQTFFMLTGLTTNFNIPFRKFAIKQLKQIGLPLISFCIITKTIGLIYFSESIYVTVAGQSFFFLCESYWFLTALFIAKIFYFFIAKIQGNLWRFLSCLILCVLGFAITYLYRDTTDPSHYNNYFHYRNGLCMLIFLWFGTIIPKIKDRVAYLLTIAFVLLYAITFLVNWKTGMPLLGFMPMEYTHICKFVSFIQIIPYLFYALAGSIMIIWLAKLINKHLVLEYIGKNSLVFYCMHFTIIQSIIPIFFRIAPPQFIANDGSKLVPNNHSYADFMRNDYIYV